LRDIQDSAEVLIGPLRPPLACVMLSSGRSLVPLFE